MNKLTAFLGIALLTAWLGCACTVAPMFNPPISNDIATDGETAKKLSGDWISMDKDGKSEAMRLTVKNEEQKNKTTTLRLTLWMSQKKADSDATELKPLWLIGAPVKLGGETYVIFAADMEQTVRKADASGFFGIVVRPYFYAAKISFTANGFAAALATLAKYNDKEKKWVPCDPSVTLEGNVVMNQTSELVKLITDKKYQLDETHVFVRPAVKK